MKRPEEQERGFFFECVKLQVDQPVTARGTQNSTVNDQRRPLACIKMDLQAVGGTESTTGVSYCGAAKADVLSGGPSGRGILSPHGQIHRNFQSVSAIGVLGPGDYRTGFCQKKISPFYGVDYRRKAPLLAGYPYQTVDAHSGKKGMASGKKMERCRCPMYRPECCFYRESDAVGQLADALWWNVRKGPGNDSPGVQDAYPCGKIPYLFGSYQSLPYTALGSV